MFPERLKSSATCQSSDVYVPKPSPPPYLLLTAARWQPLTGGL